MQQLSLSQIQHKDYRKNDKSGDSCDQTDDVDVQADDDDDGLTNKEFKRFR